MPANQPDLHQRSIFLQGQVQSARRPRGEKERGMGQPKPRKPTAEGKPQRQTRMGREKRLGAESRLQRQQGRAPRTAGAQRPASAEHLLAPGPRGDVRRGEELQVPGRRHPHRALQAALQVHPGAAQGAAGPRAPGDRVRRAERRTGLAARSLRHVDNIPGQVLRSDSVVASEVPRHDAPHPGAVPRRGAAGGRGLRGRERAGALPARRRAVPRQRAGRPTLLQIHHSIRRFWKQAAGSRPRHLAVGSIADGASQDGDRLLADWGGA